MEHEGMEGMVEDLKEQNEKTFDNKDDQIFKIKKLPKVKGVKPSETVVVENKRKTVSKYNALKHGKYADLPIYCNDCYYRAKDADGEGRGGNGRCEAYEKDATCSVRTDIKKYCAGLDSREPDALKTMVDDTIKQLRERVMFSIFTAGMDGNLLDKATNAQMNTLHQYIKLAKELQGSIRVTATQEETQGSSEADFITKLFKTVSVEKG